MMKANTNWLVAVSILAWPSIGLAIDLSNGSWSTSFEYSQACVQGGNGGPDCNVIADDGTRWDWGTTGVGGNYSQVVSAANNPNGDGGLGARYWLGDGSNVNSRTGSLISLSPRQPEMWIRWYMRYQAGFQWSGGNPIYDKWLYCRFGPDLPGGRNSTMELIPGSGNGGDVGIFIQGGGRFDQLQYRSKTWTEVFGAPAAGQWHMIEVYYKMDTDGTDGIGRMWVDGELIIEKTNVDFSAGDPDSRLGMRWLDFHNNQSSPANGGPMYVDYDDMAIYITDPGNRDASGNPWIGPLNGFSGTGALPRPMPPAEFGR